MSQPQIVLCSPVRTAIGTYNGTLRNTPATELGAAAARESLRRSGLDADKVQTAVFGHVVQAGAKMNPARRAAIGGGLGVQVPALTVNRVCGSGAQAVVSAALGILAGNLQCALAGGMENMDMACRPWRRREGDRASPMADRSEAQSPGG